MKRVLLIVIALVLVVAAYYFWNNLKGIYFANKPSGQNIVEILKNPSQSLIKVPPGYSLSVFAQNLGDPRDLILDPKGTLLVSDTGQGKVLSLSEKGAVPVIEGLNEPHGLAFNGSKLYVAETNGVSIYDYNSLTKKAANGKKIIDLPGGGEHFTRSLLIKDSKLYVSVGSDCNACIESDPHRAAIWQANLDGSDFKPYAVGLRNSVFMTVNPQTNEIWATNMGRDFLGDNLPPDTVNIIKSGANYGWPYCYGNKIFDSEINPGGTKFDCNTTALPEIEIPAHSAPLGLAFLGKALLIAYHGSWNRSVPTGYKIVEYLDGKFQDFLTGWLQPSGDVLGRPVDILVKSAQEIYISDDKAGVVYLLSAK